MSIMQNRVQWNSIYSWASAFRRVQIRAATCSLACHCFSHWLTGVLTQKELQSENENRRDVFPGSAPIYYKYYFMVQNNVWKKDLKYDTSNSITVKYFVPNFYLKKLLEMFQLLNVWFSS